MNSTTSKHLEMVEKYIKHGNYNEALDLIEKSTKKKGITIKDRISFLKSKSYIFNLIGKYPQALDIAVDLLQEKSLENNSLLFTDVLIQKGFALTFLGRIDEALSVVDDIEKNLLSFKQLPEIIIAERKALLFRYKWWIYHQLGKRDEFLQYASDYLDCAKKSEKEDLIAQSYVINAYLFISDEPNYDLSK